MAIDTDEIRVGATGTLYSAPIGSTAPTTTVGGWDAAWTDLGALSEDGPSITPSMDVSEIKIWQSLYAVRRIVTDRGMDWKFTLMQRNAHNFVLAMGGGAITETGVGSNVWKYVPPDASEIDERMFGIEVVENSIIDRYILARGMVTDFGEIPIRRDAPTQFELTVSVLASDDADPWVLISNDPAMEPA